MKKTFTNLIPWLFIFLFVYTGLDKLADHRAFAGVLSRAPVIGRYSNILALMIPLAELSVAALLIVPQTQTRGLYASLILMMIFSSYLTYMLLSGSRLPCHCGGVISMMSWKQHLIFNIAFVALAVTRLITEGNYQKKDHINSIYH